MIACISISTFPLRAALRNRPELRRRPAALGPRPDEQAVVGACTAAAEREGVHAGMRLSEALAVCPELVLVEPDPSGAEDAWEAIVRRLEDAGLAVEAREAGTAYFETDGVERLAGGLDAVLRRALEAIGTEWEPRMGAASRRFTALAAATVAPVGRAIVVDDDESALFLEPLPLDVLSLTPERRHELSELGIRKLGQLARLPAASVADRLGSDGADAWEAIRGEEAGGDEPRRPPSGIEETLEFPDAVANELTLQRALGALVDRLLARPERGGRAPREVALSARLVGGGSWRRAVTLREPTAEPERLRLALTPRLGELPAPALALRLELGELAESVGKQEELVRPHGSRLRDRLKDGLRQVRVGAGLDAVCSVVEVAPWSRIPEARAILVPRDD
ncbi:MAG: DNA polymerase Y family protein [Actinobacteria bacterium]|nr:DNA polymerase Y family protein [Actinomycetota bacterium]